MEQGKKSFFYWMNKVEDAVLGVGFIILIAVTFLQVVMRTVFNNSLTWSEEFVRYLYIWLCWIGVSLAERRNEHIRLTILTDTFPKKAQEWVDILVSVILVVISGWLIYQGVLLGIHLKAAGAISTALKLPMYLVYISMPTGCLLFAIRVAVKLVGQIKALKEA